MTTFLSELIAHIALTMGYDVRLVDEDCGQLEALQYGEDQYPVTFPCVMVGTPETEWKTFKSDGQRGKAVLSVRIAFDCYDDTHYGSGGQEAAAERARIVHKLNMMIQGWGCASSGAMNRLRSRGVALPKGVKVYETVYEVNVADTVTGVLEEG
jgi:hypothetical protein